MPDKAWMKAEILKGAETLIDMATESELRVLGELVGLQLLKAFFVRGAGSMGMNAEELARCQRDIEERSRVVADLVKLLDECHANAILAATSSKH